MNKFVCNKTIDGLHCFCLRGHTATRRGCCGCGISAELKIVEVR